MCGLAAIQWCGSDISFKSIELEPLITADIVQRYVNVMSGWHVAVERYTPDGRVATTQLDAVEVIGMLRFVTYTTPRLNVSFELQSRSDMRKMPSNTELRQLGMHLKTRDDHANDATRHLLLSLLRRFPIQYELLTRSIPA
jgi:hypothetical protein